jgi:hypothetical protein
MGDGDQTARDVGCYGPVTTWTLWHLDPSPRPRGKLTAADGFSQAKHRNRRGRPRGQRPKSR